MKRIRSGQGAHPSAAVLGLVALALFAVWSNAFIAIDELLGRGGTGPMVLDWWELVVVRFGLVSLCMGIYLAVRHARTSLRLLRREWPRLLLLGFLAVPGYNVFLYFAQQQGVPPAIASLATAATPLYLMILGRIFLHEHIGAAKITGFLVAAVGMVMIASSKDLGPESFAYPLLVLCALGAPLCWAISSVVVKPMLREESPLVVMFLCVTVMGLPLLVWLGTDLGGQLFGSGARALGARDWALLLYLIGPCTLLGFPLWNWLVKHLPASTVGFTVFLNPPLTFGFSYLFQGVAPLPLEVAGTVVVLAGVGRGGGTAQPGRFAARERFA